jgi:hypothetical protein
MKLHFIMHSYDLVVLHGKSYIRPINKSKKEPRKFMLNE